MTDQFAVSPLAVDQWDESLSFIKADMNGNPINVHRLMAHHPELLKAWWNFRNYSVRGGALGKRKGELVILRVALHMRAWYEWGSHVERALDCGLSRKEIERVKLGGDASGWDESEAMLLNAIDELIATHGLKPATHAQLRVHYDLKQVMDIIAIHGMYVILACMINTWGLELDPQVQAKLPVDVTKSDFEAHYPR